jgi:hypothetical protein
VRRIEVQEEQGGPLGHAVFRNRRKLLQGTNRRVHGTAASLPDRGWSPRR